MSLINKPWGHEYLLFENEHVAVWHLVIMAGHCTSLHCHPDKKTGLVVLDGAAKVSFLSGNQRLFAGEKVMIRQGVFHQTTNMVSVPLQLLEIETPKDKGNIVRLEDNYGRAGSTDMEYSEGVYQSIDLRVGSSIGNVRVANTSVTYDAMFDGYFDFNHLMVTGGRITGHGYEVAGPGDVISRETLEMLSLKFEMPDVLEGISISC